MKRCPQCNRSETDETLAFCRVDGTALVNQSGDKLERSGTLRITPSRVANGAETRILSPHTDGTLEPSTTNENKAFAELNKAYENRLSSLCWLKVEPQLDPLRSDPRYTDLLRKMNFPK